MRERYLLRADRQGYRYSELLEFTPGSARLLVPDKGRRSTWWRVVGAAVVLDVFGIGILLNLYGAPVQNLLEAGLGLTWGLIVYLLIPWIPVVVITVVADHELPAYLAKHPVQVLPLHIVGSTSYGFFQELNALSDGRPLRITVNGRRKGVARALTLMRETLPAGAA